MTKTKKIFLWIAFITLFISITVIKAPAWLIGSIASKYSGNRLSTRNETGTFWNGSALMVASDIKGEHIVPLMRIDWNIKLGLTKFITLNVNSVGQPIAEVSLVKNGLQMSKVNLSLTVNQLTTFSDNLNTLNLSGNVHVSADDILLGKKYSGTLRALLEQIGSGMSPVNPIGTYDLSYDLSNNTINVATNGASVINVSGSGTASTLSLKAQIAEDKKDQMLQFMTMMGMPQADGSYLLKVF